jgi:hypothetical protein
VNPVPAPRTEPAAPQEPVPALQLQDQAPARPADTPGPQLQDQQAPSAQVPPPPAPEPVVEELRAEEPDALDAPASDDTLLTPGDAEEIGAENHGAQNYGAADVDAAEPEPADPDAVDPNAAGPDDEGDIEETVVHTKAQRANLPANPTAGYAAPSAQTPPAAIVTGAPAGPPAQAPAPARQTASLIDSVPWLTPSASARARAAESQAAEAAGRVQPTSAQPAVPASAAQPAAPASSRSALEGDHDGQTLMRSDLKSLPGGGEAAKPPAEPPATTGPMVLARVCPQGHANPPTRSACSRCAAPLASDASEVKRPSLGKMRLSSGEVIELDRPVIVGRQPAASRVQGNVMPQLVQVRSVSGDISRSHLEVRLEGWHVILGDLKATNGTMLIREGQPPRRLGQGESMILFDGDIADLGDGVSLRFEDLL